MEESPNQRIHVPFPHPLPRVRRPKTYVVLCLLGEGFTSLLSQCISNRLSPVLSAEKDRFPHDGVESTCTLVKEQNSQLPGEARVPIAVRDLATPKRIGLVPRNVMEEERAWMDSAKPPSEKVRGKGVLRSSFKEKIKGELGKLSSSCPEVGFQ